MQGDCFQVVNSAGLRGPRRERVMDQKRCAVSNLLTAILTESVLSIIQSALVPKAGREFRTLFHSPFPPVESYSLSLSGDTSPTIPLSFSQTPEEAMSFGDDDVLSLAQDTKMGDDPLDMARRSESKSPSSGLFATAPLMSSAADTPSKIAMDQVGTASPFEQAQIGPHNAHLFVSPAKSSLQALPAPVSTRLSVLSPDSKAATFQLVRTPHPPLPSLPPSPTPYRLPSIFPLVAPIELQPPLRAEPPEVVHHPKSISLQQHPQLPADPALEQFLTARTFRTRTVLQLQPYTKERQIYEAALRRGGPKKGKKAIAEPREIGREEEDHSEEGGEEDSSEAEEMPDRIVIGGDIPSSSAQRKPRALKPLIKADFDEYFLEYGEEADEDDPLVSERLQDIARKRLRDRKLQRRRAKEAEMAKKQFEHLMNASATDEEGMAFRNDVSEPVGSQADSCSVIWPI